MPPSFLMMTLSALITQASHPMEIIGLSKTLDPQTELGSIKLEFQPQLFLSQVLNYELAKPVWN
jgi:hypothetical protein